MNSCTHPLPSLRSGLPPLCFAKRGKISYIQRDILPLLYEIEKGAGGMSTCRRETSNINLKPASHLYYPGEQDDIIAIETEAQLPALFFACF